MKYKKVTGGYFIRIERNEKIMQTLTQFAKEKNLESASVTGIGAVKNTEIGAYHLDKKEYTRKTFEQDAELTNLTGNLSKVNNQPFFHCHVTLADPQYQAYAGHLFEAECAVTVEIYLKDTESPIHRTQDETIGLKLLDFT